MSLSDELARPMQRVPHPHPTSRKSLLEAEADKAVAAFGGVPRDEVPQVDILAKVELALGQNGDGLSRLGRRDLKVVPYIIWGRNLRWRTDESFIRSYLAVVKSTWPTGMKRIWRHYLVNFETGSPATNETGRWLMENFTKLPEALQNFSKLYGVLNVDSAPRTMAAAVLSGSGFTDDLRTIGFGEGALRSSAVSVAIMAAVGERLSFAQDVRSVPERLQTLFGGDATNAILEATCDERTRSVALRTFVDGMISWQDGASNGNADPERTLDLLLALNGDPRFVPDRWHGKVSPQAIAVMDKWLSRATIEAFFRVIDYLNTDRPDMWRSRKTFWLSYLPHITKAWLVVGQDARPLAEQQGIRFGKFMYGDGTQRDHCGLMLQIRNTCILEMNKNGRAVFWDSGFRNLPGLYGDEYNRSLYLNSVDNRNIFGIAHNGDWQSRFKTRIHQMTGIFVR